MKYCPKCRTQYTDDSLKYCLQDGAPLAEATISQMKTADYGETETVVAARPPSRISVDYQTAPDETHRTQTTQNNYAPTAPPPKSRVGLAVALTILGMLVIFGGIGGLALLYFKDRKTEIAQNINSNANSLNAVTPNKSVNAKTPTPTPKANTNANTNTNVNAAVNNSLPTANAAAVKKEVAVVVDGWKSAAEALNLDAQMEKYAETVDYYNKKGASRDFVRNDRGRAFSKYDSVDITISNLVVTPDASGTRAIAVFDKEWNFDGEEKTSTGKVKTQLDLQNIHGEWRITGEKDLKVYYSE